MKRQIEGGLRRPKNQAIPVPIEDNIRLNKYGSLTRNKVKNLLADKDKYFSGKLKGAKGKGTGEGIWQRMPANSKRKKNRGGKVRMVISWNPKADYKASFPFKRIVETTVKTNFRKRFDFELREALKTAR